MVVEKEFHQLLKELYSRESGEIVIGDSTVTLKIFDTRSKLSLITNIYDGDGLIPSSVRDAASHSLPTLSPIHTSLRMDEGKGMIFLSYIGSLEHLTKANFQDLLESFAVEADRWRNYLDDHDHREKVRVIR